MKTLMYSDTGGFIVAELGAAKYYNGYFVIGDGLEPHLLAYIEYVGSLGSVMTVPQVRRHFKWWF